MRRDNHARGRAGKQNTPPLPDADFHFIAGHIGQAGAINQLS
jgi:hypothetical protein